MKKDFSTIITLVVSSIILGVLALFAFPEANLTFGVALFVGYLAFTVLYGPAKNYMGYPTKKPIAQA